MTLVSSNIHSERFHGAIFLICCDGVTCNDLMGRDHHSGFIWCAGPVWPWQQMNNKCFINLPGTSASPSFEADSRSACGEVGKSPQCSGSRRRSYQPPRTSAWATFQRHIKETRVTIFYLFLSIFFYLFFSHKFQYSYVWAGQLGATLKDIGRACAAAWPASLHHWSRPSGSGGRSPRFWLLRHLMPPGPEIPCGFRGTRWSSRPGRSCRLHADGRRLTDRPLSLCRASRWWLTGREEAWSGSTKSRLVIGCITVQKLLKWQMKITQLFLLCSTITGWTNHMMPTQPEER